MIEITSPDKFKKTPWKNGKGFTTELAINNGGSLTNFDWRLSIASVAENGFFSDFSGYKRHLVLIDGNGIYLKHDDVVIDELNELLDVAVFNGASKTYGKLNSGPINDFNLMVNSKKLQSNLKTYACLESFNLPTHYLTFIYSLTDKIEIISDQENQTQSIPQGNLVKITKSNNTKLKISGKNLILSFIDPV